MLNDETYSINDWYTLKRMKTFTRKRVAQRGFKLLPHTPEWTIKVSCHDIEQIKENKPWTSSGYDFKVSSSPHTFPITYIFLSGLSTTPEQLQKPLNLKQSNLRGIRPQGTRTDDEECDKLPTRYYLWQHWLTFPSVEIYQSPNTIRLFLGLFT